MEIMSNQLRIIDSQIDDADNFPSVDNSDDIQLAMEIYSRDFPVRKCAHYLLAKERWHWEREIWKVVRANNDIISVDNLRLTQKPRGYRGLYEDVGLLGGVVLTLVDFSLASLKTAVFGPFVSIISVFSRASGLRSRLTTERRLRAIKDKIGPIHNRHRSVRTQTFARFDDAAGYDPRS